MILLDTNVLSELMRQTPWPSVIRWMDEQPAASLYISAITVAEIKLGICLLPEGKRRQMLNDAADEMFKEFSDRCLSFDENAAGKYAILTSRRMNIGRPISVEDAQIAAIALFHGMALGTRNTKDFDDISELEVINPWNG